MDRLKEFPLVYLATPYTKYEGGIDVAFRDAAVLAAHLLKARCRVYSPIVHCHPIAVQGGLDPLDHDIWIPFHAPMMDAASALLVAQMEGWRESHGVTHEIKVFARAQKPIFYLDPAALRVGLAPLESEAA